MNSWAPALIPGLVGSGFAYACSPGDFSSNTAAKNPKSAKVTAASSLAASSDDLGEARQLRSNRQNRPAILPADAAKWGAGKVSFRAFQRHLGGLQTRSQSGAMPERVAEKGLASL